LHPKVTGREQVRSQSASGGLRLLWLLPHASLPLGDLRRRAAGRRAGLIAAMLLLALREVAEVDDDQAGRCGGG
jgi:hypothetical protein